VLKLSNDAIRVIKKEVDCRYVIEYVPPMEDIIIVRQHRNVKD